MTRTIIASATIDSTAWPDDTGMLMIGTAKGATNVWHGGHSQGSHQCLAWWPRYGPQARRARPTDWGQPMKMQVERIGPDAVKIALEGRLDITGADAIDLQFNAI